MTGYSPTIVWAGPVRRVAANCQDCHWGTDDRVTTQTRRHLMANPTHRVTVEATNVTVFSALAGSEVASRAS